MATIDEIYIHKGRLYLYKAGGGWFVTTGTKQAIFYEYENYTLEKGNLFDLQGTNYWEVEEGSKYEYRDVIKTIFNKNTVIEQ